MPLSPDKLAHWTRRVTDGQFGPVEASGFRRLGEQSAYPGAIDIGGGGCLIPNGEVADRAPGLVALCAAAGVPCSIHAVGCHYTLADAGPTAPPVYAIATAGDDLALAWALVGFDVPAGQRAAPEIVFTALDGRPLPDALASRFLPVTAARATVRALWKAARAQHGAELKAIRVRLDAAGQVVVDGDPAWRLLPPQVGNAAEEVDAAVAAAG